MIKGDELQLNVFVWSMRKLAEDGTEQALAPEMQTLRAKCIKST